MRVEITVQIKPRNSGGKMKHKPISRSLAIVFAFAALMCGVATSRAADKKPNILFIMGDDIGWMQPSCYHRGLMVGETPNIDRIAKEGGMFMTYYAEQSCTSGRNAFFTGMHPLRTGMIPPQLPGSPSYLRPGTPALAVFLHDLGYTTGQFGKNHLGDHTDALPTAHGFTEFWGYLYHLDAMQQVSFPDINKSPTVQGVVPPCKNTPVKGLTDPPGAIDPRQGTCLTPPRPMIACTSSDGTSKNQTCKDEGPLTLERSKTVDEEISSHVVDFLDRNDPKKTNKPFFVWYNPARMHITTVLSDKYLAMLGEPGGKDWGIWEGGMRAPCVIRWPGVIKPGTIFSDIFASLDWLPTFVEIAGGPKGNDLKGQLEKGAYKGIVKTTLDGVNQLDYLTGKSEKSARDTFFYYDSTTPSAVRYKNWKLIFAIANESDFGFLYGPKSQFMAGVVNLKRDPFETSWGDFRKAGGGWRGWPAAPGTAYLYDWHMLPIGQLLWLKELESYKAFPPLQAPESLNLDQVMAQVRSAKHASE